MPGLQRWMLFIISIQSWKLWKLRNFRIVKFLVEERLCPLVIGSIVLSVLISWYWIDLIVVASDYPLSIILLSVTWLKDDDRIIRVVCEQAGSTLPE